MSNGGFMVMQPPDGPTLDSHCVDFLIVTALKDEYDAMIALLPESEVQGCETIACIPRINATGSFRVAIIISGQTNALAEAAVKDAILHCTPRAVILTGIAAGFPESGVTLGDVLIPFRIVPYEHAKISEQPAVSVFFSSAPLGHRPTATPPMVKYQHRGEPLDVSHPLWIAAEALSRDPKRPWLKRILTPRPSSEKTFPTIHADRGYKLGSGDKLVASELAEARKWLIDTYGRHAIGLEMEAYGAIIGCRSADIPFLLVKASQDPATVVKDDASSKDLWRPYAAAAAAAFVLALIERYRFPDDAVRVSRRLPSCFVPGSDRLRFLLERNFLFDFDHSGRPDYLCLLSADYRKLFFHFWKKSKRICVSGPEGCGKTFNTLLLTEKLRGEGYDTHYTSIRAADLSGTSLSQFATLTRDRDVLLIDDCQDDLDKTKGLLEEASRSSCGLAKRYVIFLTRPLEPEDHIDTFGQGMPVLHFHDHFVDFPALVALFFEKLHRTHDLRRFMIALSNETLSRELFRYRNMEFWNTYFNTMAYTADFTFDHGQFYTRVHAYLRTKELAFLDPSFGLMSLFPFFANGLPVLRDWAIHRLGVTEKQLAELSSRGLVRETFLNWDNLNWENDTAVFVVGAMHPTKVRLATLVATKYCGVSYDEVGSLTSYANGNLPNLYYVVCPLSFRSPDLFTRLCSNAEFLATLRAYVMQRHLGKQLDRVLSRLARTSSTFAHKLMDPVVLDSLVTRLNEKHPYVISKALLLRAIHRIDPSLSYQVFRRFDLGSIVAAFKAGEPGASLPALSKLMEFFKNVYYAAPVGEEKASVGATVRQMVVECSPEMVEGLEKAGFGELHWLMKRLDPIKLHSGDILSVAHEFLRSIPPDRLARWISTKNVRLNELRFVFKLGRRLTVLAEDGYVALYPDYFRTHLSAGCLQWILGNPRTRLYDIAITSKFGHEVLAYPLLHYAREGGLASKVASESSIFRVNESIDLLEGTRDKKPIGTISEEDRALIIRCIIENMSIDRHKIASTRREAKRIGRKVDIDREIERFRATAARYHQPG
jgi:nucleoside phosphorylase